MNNLPAGFRDLLTRETARATSDVRLNKRAAFTISFEAMFEMMKVFQEGGLPADAEVLVVETDMSHRVIKIHFTSEECESVPECGAPMNINFWSRNLNDV